eukprot:366286-Chlamydomonas_euryale.AAC.15
MMGFKDIAKERGGLTDNSCANNISALGITDATCPEYGVWSCSNCCEVVAFGMTWHVGTMHRD